MRRPNEIRTDDRNEESGEDEAVIVVQSIKITDNFAFDKEKENLSNDKELKNVEYDLEKFGLKGFKKSNTILNCISTTTISMLVLLLVLIQIGFIIFWFYFKHAIKTTKNRQWWKENSAFDNQIDSIRYANTPSFYKNKPTHLNAK